MKIGLLDSGIGLLAAAAAVRKRRGDVDLVLAADPDGMPWGPRTAQDVTRRALGCARDAAAYGVDALIVACNTASVHALPALRAALEPGLPVIGTVPAIKPAATQSRSGLISVLATPGTVARDYTRELVRTYAAHCAVTLAGSSALAPLAEAFMQGKIVSDVDIAREIAPAFVTAGQLRTDCIVLACTHYPLLLEQFERLAPWPVEWIDPAPAIAKRTAHVLREQLGFLATATPSSLPNYAVFTGTSTPGPELLQALRLHGLEKAVTEPMPLA